MTVRFIHCSDLHLGAPYSVLPRKVADRRRAQQRETFARIVDLALEQPEKADILLIAGDLFDSDRPAPRDIAFVRSQIRRLTDGGVRTFMIPGNHDPYRADNFWCKANLGCTRFFEKTGVETFDVNGTKVSVCGIPPDVSNPSKNPLATFDETIPSENSMLLFHGSWLNFGKDTAEFHPFELSDIEGLPFSYVALGHYHACTTVASGRPCALYAGAPEAIGFSKNDLGEKYVVVGKISNGRATARPHRINTVEHICDEIDCTVESEASLREKIEHYVSPSHIVRLDLMGNPSAEVIASVRSLQAEFENECAHLVLNSRFAHVGDFPPDNIYLNRFVELMSARIEEAAEEQKPLLTKALELGIRAFMKEE